MRSKLDLLMPPLRGTVVAGDQPHPMHAPEVAVDERIPRLRLLGRALGETKMPSRVLLPRVRLEERVLLTRARQGMVVFVPPGDSADPTRSPSFYSSTFEYLKELGISEIR